MANQIDSSVNQRFSSRWGLILSTLGVAVGTGNIWRFPRIASSNGGEEGAGALIIAWVIFLFLWSIPLIIAEYAIGRKQRKRDFRKLWIARISAATRQRGVSYSVFVNAMNKSGIKLNRKILADLAVRDENAFTAVLDAAMKN